MSTTPAHARPLRVLTVMQELSIGGIQRVAQVNSIWLKNAGFDVSMFAFLRGGVREADMAAAGIPVTIGSEDPTKREAALRRALDPCPDVIHLHRSGLPEPHWSGHVLRLIRQHAPRRIGVVETSHFARFDYSEEGRLIDVHAQISEWCFWKWGMWTRSVRPAPVGCLLLHMVDPTPFTALSPRERSAFRARNQIPDDAIVFGRIARSSEGGWDRLIFPAFERYATENPRAYLVMVSPPESYPPLIQALPENVRSRVRVLPLIHGDPLLREAYGSFDVYLHMAMIGESFGLGLCEAMLCEVPCITRQVPAKGNTQAEVVGHERGGLVAHSLEGVVDSMRRLGSDPALRARLGRAGREWTINTLAPDRVGPTLKAIMEETAAHAAAGPAALRAALDRRGVQTAPTTSARMKQFLSSAAGTPSIKDLAMMHAIHQPTLFKAYLGLQNLRRRA